MGGEAMSSEQRIDPHAHAADCGSGLGLGFREPMPQQMERARTRGESALWHFAQSHTRHQVHTHLDEPVAPTAGQQPVP